MEPTHGKGGHGTCVNCYFQTGRLFGPCLLLQELSPRKVKTKPMHFVIPLKKTTTTRKQSLGLQLKEGHWRGLMNTFPHVVFLSKITIPELLSHVHCGKFIDACNFSQKQ